MIALAVFVSILLLYSLASQRLGRTPLTAPIVVTVAGMLMFCVTPELMRAGVNSQVFLRLAEVGLVLLLFTDASRTDLKILRNIENLPERLLSVGLLLTILLGAVACPPRLLLSFLVGSGHPGSNPGSHRCWFGTGRC